MTNAQPMGMADNRPPERDEDLKESTEWQQFARTKGFVCKMCGELLAPEELEFGFTETCAHCDGHLAINRN
jgi:hypothetical protein